MTSAIRRLREKLCRELAQCEHYVAVHCCREARRYGAQPPARALLALAGHATTIRPQLRPLLSDDLPVGVRAGRAIAELISTLRHFVFDWMEWMLDAERAYRATLLGLRHGLNVARLLREVLLQQHDYPALRICDNLLSGREPLIMRAEERLRWFAENPEIALRTSRPAVVTRAATQHE